MPTSLYRIKTISHCNGEPLSNEHTYKTANRPHTIYHLYKMQSVLPLAFSKPSGDFFLPVLVSDEGSCQLDIVPRLRLELAHCGSTLFDHVEKHLRQLRILVQIHQVRKTIVHFECHTCFLKTKRKYILSHIVVSVWTQKMDYSLFQGWLL